MQVISYAAIVLFGLAIGSFLNVCIHRLPSDKSIVRPGSHCPKCGEPIRSRDNIPVLSYLLLKGRCRNCGQRISFRYPVVEVASALMLVLVYMKFGPTIEFFGYGYFCLALLVIFFTDIDKRIIPDRVIYPSLVLGLIFTALTREIVSGLLGMVLGFCVLFFVGWLGRLIFKKEAMGGGDIKMAAVVGIFLGWKLLLVSLFLSVVLGAVVGAAIMALRGKKGGSEIPFGSFIAVGSIISLFWGAQLIRIYLGYLWR